MGLESAGGETWSLEERTILMSSLPSERAGGILFQAVRVRA